MQYKFIYPTIMRDSAIMMSYPYTIHAFILLAFKRGEHIKVHLLQNYVCKY